MDNLKSNITNEDLVFKFIEFEQPAGKMYMGVLFASEIYQIAKVNRLSEKYKNGDLNNITDRLTQRDLKDRRIKEIATYAEDKDAIFPTPIILSGNSDYVDLIDDKIYFKKGAEEQFSIIDGQHRLFGIMESNRRNDLVLPCVIMFNTEPYEDALIFITINGKQVRVPSSIIYELFEISPDRSIEKTLHNLAKAFNDDSASPFRNSIKMLGYKLENQDFAPITQSSFVTPLKDLILKKQPFKELFENEEDGIIYKILLNYFLAAREVFDKDWENEESILQKSVGFKAMVTFLGDVLIQEAIEHQDFTMDFFANRLKFISDNMNTPITSKEFGSSYGDAGRLSKKFKEILEEYRNSK